MKTIGEIVSRLRISIKATKQDAFVTDRFLFSLVKKYAAGLVRRLDSSNKVMKMNSVFQVLEDIELIEVSKISSSKAYLHGHTILRTKDRLPAMLQGYWGPIIRSITSVSGEGEFVPTYPTVYEKMCKQKTFKYNTKFYYWLSDGYFFFPNIEWDSINMEAAFEENIKYFNADKRDDCTPMQQSSFNVPDFLFGEIEALVKNDLGIMIQIPTDTKNDNLNLVR